MGKFCNKLNHPAIMCSQLTIETPEQCVKSINFEQVNAGREVDKPVIFYDVILASLLEVVMDKHAIY